MKCQHCGEEVREVRDLGSGEWLCYTCYMCLCCTIWDKLEVRDASSIEYNIVQD